MNQRKTSSASEGSATRDGNEIERSDSSDEEDSDSDASKGSKAPEHFEKRDRWIAKFYSLMDTRRTPINKGPCIANKDLDLYKLFKVSYNYFSCFLFTLINLCQFCFRKLDNLVAISVSPINCNGVRSTQR